MSRRFHDSSKVPKVVISAKLASDPLEWLFKIIVALCGNIEVLKVFLSVKVDMLRQHFAVLDFNLVPS